MPRSSDIGLVELVTILPDAALVVSAEGRIVLANELAATLFGYSRSALVGLPVDALVPESLRARHADQRSRYLAVPKPGPMAWGRRLRARRADGTTFPADVSLSPFRIRDELFVLACVRDTTPYEQMLAALEEAERRYRQLVEDASEVFYRVIFDDRELEPLKARCHFVSPQSEKITGYPPGEFLGNPSLWFELIHEDDRQSVRDETLRCLSEKRSVTRYYRVRHRSTGEFRWVADRIVPILGPSGEVLGYQGVARDITERREAEERQRSLERQLAAAERLELVGRLAAGVAHDFNNILAVVLTGCELALADLDHDSAAAHELREVLAAAKRGADLTRQLLAVGRRQVIAPQPLNLSLHIQAAQRLLRSVVPESITIEYQLPTDLWTVLIDPTQVEQVVMNLVINAKDAMPEGGSIAIEAANVIVDEVYCAGRRGLDPGEYVRLTVRDTGHGMDADTLSRAFEPFFSTKPRGRGSGLGLASVYGIVKQNHGYIEIASNVGRGTAVLIYLPRSHEEPKEQSSHSTGSQLSGGELRGTVLVVDDEEQVRSAIRRYLERLGLQVLEAAGPAAALEICDRHAGDLDLLLTDLVMPEMDGVALSRHVLARRQDTAVVYMSGYAPKDLPGGVLWESSQYIEKPFTLEALAHAVRGALERRSRSQRKAGAAGENFDRVV